MWKKIKESFLSLDGGAMNDGASISLHSDSDNGCTLSGDGIILSGVTYITTDGIYKMGDDANENYCWNTMGNYTDLSGLMEFYNTYGDTLKEVAAALQAGKKIVYYEESAS